MTISTMLRTDCSRYICLGFFALLRLVASEFSRFDTVADLFPMILFPSVGTIGTTELLRIIEPREEEGKIAASE